MACFVFLAVSFALQLAVALIAKIFNKDILDNELFLLLLGEITGYFIALPISLLIIRTGKRSYFTPEVKMNFKDILVAFCVTYGLTYLGSYLSAAVTQLLGLLIGHDISDPLASIPTEMGPEFIVEFIAILVVAPILEELLFRKFLMDAILPFGAGTAIIVSGISFGLVHGNFYQFFYTALVGLIFAYIYSRTRKVIYTIILHFMLNFFGGGLPMLLNKSYEAMENIFSSDSFEAILAALEKNAMAALPAMIISFVLMGVGIAGLVILFSNIRKAKFGKASMPIPKGKWFSTVILNPGTILFILTAIFIFAMSIVGM